MVEARAEVVLTRAGCCDRLPVPPCRRHVPLDARVPRGSPATRRQPDRGGRLLDRRHRAGRGAGSLRRSEANFRALIERSPTATFVHRDGHIVYANPPRSRLFGYDTAAEIVGLRRSRADPSRRSRVHPVARAAPVARGTTPAGEGRMIRRDGSSFVVEAEAIRLDFDGQTVERRDRARRHRARRDVRAHGARRSHAVGRHARRRRRARDQQSARVRRDEPRDARRASCRTIRAARPVAADRRRRSLRSSATLAKASRA